MVKKTFNHVKLGIFVIAGMAFLILLLYIIGKNQNLFGKTFVLKARFDNVHGLMRGNNIRFGGIDVGTVGGVDVVNDTTFEVTLLVKTKFKNHIHNNAAVNITTDGLMGNKLINIVPARKMAPLVQEGDILFSTKMADTDEMLEVLNNTNNDVAVIAKELKQTVQRINSSKPVWSILNDETLPSNLRASLIKMNRASGNLTDISEELSAIVANVRNGKGSIGQLLMDSAIALNINEAIEKIKSVGVTADTLSGRINALVTDISNEINNGNGTVNAVLKDDKMRGDLTKSLQNIERGTKAFNDNMEALKHGFLFRGYFRRLERKQQDSSKHY